MSYKQHQYKSLRKAIAYMMIHIDRQKTQDLNKQLTVLHMIPIACNEHSKSLKISSGNEFRFNRIRRSEGVFPLMEQPIREKVSPSLRYFFTAEFR